MTSDISKDRVDKIPAASNVTGDQPKHAKVPAHLWLIHGKLYDFNSYVDKHPGGKTFILTGRGRDCTELFESVHALCPNHPKSIIENYLVEENSGYSDYFSWKKDGFYSTVTNRVKAAMKDQPTIKGDTFYWTKVFLQTLVWLFCLYQFLINGSYISAFLYGAIFEMIGFCVMHDASHGAVSKNSWINEHLSLLWNGWAQWSHWIWMQHHVYAHHSYTSIYQKDPDLIHWVYFIRKSKDVNVNFFQQWQSNTWWFIVSIWPNQHMGQMIIYQLVLWFKKRLFGMPVTPAEPTSYQKEFLISMVSLFVHFILPFLLHPPKIALSLVFLAFTGMGLSYWFCVFPNHDTMESHEALEGKTVRGMDWGELQVRSSCDHSSSGMWVNVAITQMWGGMNYQIEHHLFPAMNHVWYPKIAPIVKETCKEYNIPYPYNDNWLTCLSSYVKFLKVMEK